MDMGSPTPLIDALFIAIAALDVVMIVVLFNLIF
jgi:hypothetical protein